MHKRELEIMICPRCKENNDKDAINCHNCGLKLKIICPRCEQPNKLGEPKCAKCNLVLIKFCPKCETPNFPHVEKCRKCGLQLKKKSKPRPKVKYTEKPTPKPTVTPEDAASSHLKKELTRNETVNFLTELLVKSEQGYLISLSAPEGLGKSTVITTVSQALKEQNIVWLWGICDPFRQNTPYSFFQDLISTLFGTPVFSLNNEDIKKSVKQILETNLGLKDEFTLKNLFKIILNENVESNDSIEKNRDDVYKSIENLLSAFNEKGRITLVVDDFEYIDKASFDCIKYLLKKGYLNNKNFLIINHTPVTSISKLFPVEIATQKMLLIQIKPLTNQELEMVMLTMLNNQDILPQSLKAKIIRQSKGLAIYVEQSLWYLFQLGVIYPEEQALKFNTQYEYIDIDPELSGLFMQRFSIIEKFSADAVKVLLLSTLFGMKFIPKLVEMAAGLKEEDMQGILNLLVNTGLYAVYNQYNFGFKHVSLWKNIFERAFNDEQLIEFSSKVISVLEQNTSTKSSILAKIAEQTGNAESLLDFYEKTAQEAFMLGDILSYTNNQVKRLEILPESHLKDSIVEQLGKVNFEVNPAVGIQYLKESIEKQEEQGNKVKIIELSGYLSRSCELIGNYQGVLDCAEKAVNLIAEDQNDSSKAVLINFSKLEAIFNLGRLEEAIMSAENEILPILSKAISKKETFPGLTIEDIKDIEYQAEFILAKALIYQGNIKANEVLKKIITKAEKENNVEYEVKALLNQALLLTIQGELRSSQEILEKLSAKDFSSKNQSQLEIEWLFIKILSHLQEGDFEKARSLCYTALPLTKENRDYNLFAILKLLNGLFYQYFHHYNNAISLYDEVAHYCSEKKMATGALYAWYCAADAELQTGNPERAEEIAEKALDIAKKPNINNFISQLLISRLIAETKTIKGDFEVAQIYIENSIDLAEKNKLNFLLIELYITFGKIYQENATTKEDKREYSSNYANRLYAKALGIAEKLDNNFVLTRVEKEITSLHTFCKLSGVSLDKPGI